MTEVDYEALRRRYAQERDKRLRPDGNDQYLQLTGQFGSYLDDPYTERAEPGAAARSRDGRVRRRRDSPAW